MLEIISTMNFNFINPSKEDQRISVIGEGKAKRIDDLLKEHVKDARKFAATVYKKEAPPTGVGLFGRTTGDLKQALQRTRVRKGPDGNYGFEAYVSPITEGRTAPESLYPLYVEYGTKGPIRPANGNVLALRDKSKGRRIFAFKESVRGQEKNNYFGRMRTAVGFEFKNATAMRVMANRIENIIFGPDLD